MSASIYTPGADDVFNRSGFIGTYFAFILNRTREKPFILNRPYSMIHIEETILDANTITIKLEGVLDLAALPVIQGVFERYLNRHLAIHLDLGGLTHITREGRKYLNGISQNVSLKHLPKFMTLENGVHRGSNS